MVASNFATLVEAAWPEMQAVLRKGLDEEEGKELKTLVTLVERPSDLRMHVRLSWTRETLDGLVAEQALDSTAGRVYQLRIRMPEPLTQQDLDPELNDPQPLLEWAGSIREAERAWILNKILKNAVAAGELNRDAVEALGPGTRIITGLPVPGLADLCRTRGIAVVELGVELPDLALAYPAEAFAASRLEDFAPTFEYEPEAISLVVTERIELVRWGAAQLFTSIGSITPPPAAPAAQSMPQQPPAGSPARDADRDPQE